MSSNRWTITATGQERADHDAPRALHPETVGDLLLRYRVAAGLTQEELAERATLSVRAIGDLERGAKQRPHRETIRLLADALDLSAAEHDHFRTIARQPRAPAATLASLTAVPSNLPTQLTPLIGRAEEVRAASAMLRRASVRLLTITGPGGIGKTRLAIAVAETLRAVAPDGVVFAPLVAVRDPALVPSTLAQALDVRERAGDAVYETVVQAIGKKRLLLVLDNFEHLTDAAPEIALLLAACPNIRVLVTSRAALRVRGERDFPLGPLALPAAVTLFNARARAINPAFAATDPDAVAEICARIEGLPLAIELAAARTRTLSPREVRARLEHRLDLLTRGPRDLPERHQTMRGAIAWSHDLLSPEERLLFRRLAVFADGWTVTAAEAVCASDDLPVRMMLDGIESLVDQSLIRVGAASAHLPRLAMFEAIRAFALEQLAISGEREALERRHACYCLGLAEELDRLMQGVAQAAARAQFDAERDNLRAALEWARATGETTIGLRLAGALGRSWDMAAHYHEGRAWLETFLATPHGDDPTASVRALNAAATLARKQGDYAEVIARSLESLALARARRDMAGAALALSNLGIARYRQGEHPEAVMALEESVALRREHGDAFALSSVLNNLAQVVEEQGAYERALALYEESLLLKRGFDDRWNMGVVLNNVGDLARSMGNAERALASSNEGMSIGQETGDTRLVANALRNRGLVARDQGDYMAAAALYEQALGLKRELGDKRGVSSLLVYQGDVHRLMGDEARAMACYAESIALCQAIRNWKTLAECLEGVAALAEMRNDPARAARLLGFSAGMRARLGTPLPPIAREEHTRARAALCDALGADAFTAAWEAGAALTTEQAIAEATGAMIAAGRSVRAAPRPLTRD